MAPNNFECIICLKTCKSSDEIVATKCGHVFHNICLKQKHEGLLFSALRPQQCPQCLRDIKTTTQLLLKFETGPCPKDIQISEQKSHLDHMYASRNQLQLQYEASERNLKSIQAQIQAREREFFDLKNRNDFLMRQNDQLKKDIANKNSELQKLQSEKQSEKVRNNTMQQKSETSDKKIQSLQGEYNKKDKELQQLTKKLEQITQQSKELSNDLAAKNIEIQKLKENFCNTNTEVSSALFDAQIKVLKEKNMQISMELAKEIRNSSQLSVEKLKLESLLEQLKLTPQQSGKELINKAEGKQIKSRKAAKKEEAGGHSKASNQDNKDAAPSLVIRNIKETFADEAAMKKYVFKLFDVMELGVAKEDVLDISYLDGRKLNKNALVVSFKYLRLKEFILSKLDKLKTKPDWQHLVIHEYNKDNSAVIGLYHQATSLKTAGYKKVYIRNNAVFVSKSQTSEPIKINNRADIDKLINEAKDVTEI